MKSFCFIGMTDTGKSHEVKNMLRTLSADKFIFDINQEYGEFQKQTIIDFDRFIFEATKKRGHIIVFEEATVFFSNKGRSEEILKLLIGKKHHKNIVVFCFHSISDVPNYIRRYIDFFCLKRTNDTTEDVWSKHRNKVLLSYFENVKESSKLEPYYMKWFSGNDL